MNIAVYCGSAAGSGDSFINAAKRLGTWMAENGHTLVYGGGNTGLMGIVADAVLDAGGEVIGVLPDVPLIQGRRHPRLTEYVDVPSMAERKAVMIERADAFIALPGGIGTIDEITEIMSLASLDLLSAPIVLFDTDGYYDPMKTLLKSIIDNGFGRGSFFETVLFTDDLSVIGKALEDFEKKKEEEDVQ